MLAIVGLVGLLLAGSCVAVLVSLGGQSGAVKEAEPAASASGEPTTEEPTDEPTAEESADTDTGELAKAGKQKFTYEDGLEIWVTNLKRGKVGRYAAGGHPGDPMVLFTVHIKNGTSHKVDADEFTVEVSYGPEGDAAESIYDTGIDDVTGVIAKGRQKTGKYGFAVPTKHMDDLVIEVSDYEHDPALFSGSVK